MSLQPSVLSPAVVMSSNPRTDDASDSSGSATNQTILNGLSGDSSSFENNPGMSRTPHPHEQPLASVSLSARDVPIINSAVSYAVAIYPYMAEQEDELDVVV